MKLLTLRASGVFLLWGLVLTPAFVQADPRSKIKAPAPAPAKAQTKARAKVVATARRALPSGREEVSLIFENQSATYVSNSNFLAEPRERVALGYFTSPLNQPLEAEYADLLALVRMLKTAATKPPRKPGSPHAIEVLLNGKPLVAGTTAFEEVLDLFERVWALGDWKARDGIELTRDSAGEVTAQRLPGSPNAATPVPKDDLSCRPLGEGTYCAAKGFGHAYF